MRDPFDPGDRQARAKALLLKQLVSFVRDVRHEPISVDSQVVAAELVHLAHSLFPETRQ